MEIAALLKQRFNVEGQAFLTELSLLTKRGLQTLNWAEIAVKRVEKSKLKNQTQKISTSTIKGKANDVLGL
jgi:hypothetical protein